MALVNKIIFFLFLTKFPESTQVKVLTKLSDFKYVMPGRSCGVLNPVKILHKLPKNVNEIDQCTVIDLTGRQRASTLLETDTRFEDNSPLVYLHERAHKSSKYLRVGFGLSITG